MPTDWPVRKNKRLMERKEKNIKVYHKQTKSKTKIVVCKLQPKGTKSNRLKSTINFIDWQNICSLTGPVYCKRVTQLIR